MNYCLYLVFAHFWFQSWTFDIACSILDIQEDSRSLMPVPTTIEIARQPDFPAALCFARNDMVRDTIHTK